ncbi:tRNA-guanine transglycosylase [Ascodesmis nigricans]|uniref:Queuine tRNA-ribosyltransferase accessory subunit 2 n=1 Tax=Ascodesmis nigricans TaxID=341454 RepID=A0A4S2MWH0_9PEZI|nr:tRNA-guanine transglycosylase [Ascodesmis nigricans]
MATAPADIMFNFRVLSTCGTARTGQLLTKTHTLPTPTFLASSSRGVVPHLSHDTLRDHTQTPGLYVPLEDFIERGIPDSPVYSATSPTTPSPLRAFTSLPDSQLLLLSPRRTPAVQTAAANTDHSLAILTSVGFRTLPINAYITSVTQLLPDAAISPVDIPTHVPGKNRIPKMTQRTETWLTALLKGVDGKVPILAGVLPLSPEQQQLYLETLSDRHNDLAGLALWDASISGYITELPELSGLPRVAVNGSSQGGVNTPEKVLDAVENGVDVFNAGWLNEATDAGIALDFEFPASREEAEKQLGEEEKFAEKPLGIDLWLPEFATDTRPLKEGCECYACKRHHRAYINHLLNAREMSAWVLLQIHNTHLLHLFFTSIRASITSSTFPLSRRIFTHTYMPSLPPQTGEGPRVRGYQFKTDNGPKKNKKVFNRLGGEGEKVLKPDPEVGGEMREVLQETMEDAGVMVRGADSAVLVERGFAERKEEVLGKGEGK